MSIMHQNYLRRSLKIGLALICTVLLRTTVLAQLQPTNPSTQDLYELQASKDTPLRPTSPAPVNGAIGVSLDVTLACRSIAYTAVDVYFGLTSNPPKVATLTGPCSWKPTTLLAANTKYFWRVIAHNDVGTITGPTSGTWSFTTGAAVVAPPPPPPAPAPVPTTNNLLQNGTFESFSGSLATNWYTQVAAGTVFTTSVDPAGHTGQAQKVQVTAYGGWGMLYGQKLPVLTVGSSYTWTFWYKADVPVYAQVSDDSYAHHVASYALAPTSAWTSFSQTFTYTDAGADSVRFIPSVAGTFEPDDMTLVLSSTTAPPPPSTPPPPVVSTSNLAPNTPYTMYANCCADFIYSNALARTGYKAYVNNVVIVTSPATSNVNTLVTIPMPGLLAGTYTLKMGTTYVDPVTNTTKEVVSAPTTITVGP